MMNYIQTRPPPYYGIEKGAHFKPSLCFPVYSEIQT